MKAGVAPLIEELPPVYLPGVEWLMDQFWELSTDRPSAFSVGYIPGGAISRRADEIGLRDPDRRHFFRRSMRAADDIFVAHHSRPDGEDPPAQVAEVAMTDDMMFSMIRG